VACSGSELIPETVNSFRHFGRILWMGDPPITVPLPTECSTTQKNMDIHSYIQTIIKVIFIIQF
jgi:hypothetical protein